MCKVTWYFEMLIMQADTIYPTFIFVFKLLKILPYTFFHGKLTWR